MRNLVFTIGAVLLTFGSATAETKGNTKSAASIIKVEDSLAVSSADNLVFEATQDSIAADKQIIETQDEIVAPLLPGKSTEEVIIDDTKVIDGVEAKIYPLDFKKINQEKKPLKMNNKLLIGSL